MTHCGASAGVVVEQVHDGQHCKLRVALSRGFVLQVPRAHAEHESCPAATCNLQFSFDIDSHSYLFQRSAQQQQQVEDDHGSSIETASSWGMLLHCHTWRLTFWEYCHLLMKGALKKRLATTAIVPRLRGLNQAADTHTHRSFVASHP